METLNQEKIAAANYLASNIKILRKRKKISQEELGFHIGLNRGNIASYENGTAEPKICNLIRMAEFFGVSLIDLAQHDLTSEERMSSLMRLQGLCPQERAHLEGLYHKAEAFDKFLHGIHTCFTYKAKGLKNIDNLPKEAHFLHSHFEQLYEAATRLSQEHLDLLRMCRCKEEE
ncbi:MAG: hypothetical protein C7N36_16030 [Bacteroidetes bacterium]|nr:MAG: hypothetical protein C7N36_16030 [Bacteroidota bacterium]